MAIGSNPLSSTNTLATIRVREVWFSHSHIRPSEAPGAALRQLNDVAATRQSFDPSITTVWVALLTIQELTEATRPAKRAKSNDEMTGRLVSLYPAHEQADFLLAYSVQFHGPDKAAA